MRLAISTTTATHPRTTLHPTPITLPTRTTEAAMITATGRVSLTALRLDTILWVTTIDGELHLRLPVYPRRLPMPGLIGIVLEPITFLG